MGLAVDTVNNEIAIANNGDNSILIFRRSDKGDVQPIRMIKGRLTNIDRPMGIAIDARNNELWVANNGNHSAVVFGRTANGNIAPKRVIRNAPEGTASSGFGNPMAVAYDSKREEILVPN
jgi:DNA-binding beta-propeller fold protein YncE